MFGDRATTALACLGGNISARSLFMNLLALDISIDFVLLLLLMLGTGLGLTGGAMLFIPI